MEEENYKGKTYLAQGICKNCGRKNYPQWGKYAVGKKIEEYPCPQCGCMTWTLDIWSTKITDPDVGKCSYRENLNPKKEL